MNRPKGEKIGGPLREKGRASARLRLLIQARSVKGRALRRVSA